MEDSGSQVAVRAAAGEAGDSALGDGGNLRGPRTLGGSSNVRHRSKHKSRKKRIEP